MTLSPGDISTIVKALQASDWDEATVVVGDVKISVARNGIEPSHAAASVASAGAAVEPPALAHAADPAPATETPAAAPVVTPSTAPTTAAPTSSDSDVILKASSVGVFWSAPEPGSPPFVEIGSTVKENDVVGIVEIMKLMTHVAAGTAGVITAVHAENGQSVHSGSPLFSIRPDAD